MTPPFLVGWSTVVADLAALVVYIFSVGGERNGRVHWVTSTTVPKGGDPLAWDFPQFVSVLPVLVVTRFMLGVHAINRGPDIFCVSTLRLSWRVLACRVESR